MEQQVNRLVSKVETRLASLPPDQRLLIAISGIPGSGKTTLAATIVKHLNDDHHVSAATGPDAPALAAFIPMDGYHLSRTQLDALPDPSEAHRRRGAEFTFDAPAFLKLVQTVRRQTPSSATIYGPSFDHALKDPKENDIPILASTRVIVFEGLYLSLDKGPWREAGHLMDENWFVDVGIDTARRRLVERHVRSGVCKDEKEAEERASGSDLVNGEEIVRDRIPRERIDEMVVSKEDKEWEPQAQDL